MVMSRTRTLTIISGRQKPWLPRICDASVHGFINTLTYMECGSLLPPSLGAFMICSTKREQAARSRNAMIGSLPRNPVRDCFAEIRHELHEFHERNSSNSWPRLLR